MKPDPDLERRQDEWVKRQLDNAPPLTLEARALIRRLMGPAAQTTEPAPEPKGAA